MAISVGAATTAFSTAGTQTPTVAVPSGAVNGDWLYALISYSGDLVPAPAAGWEEVAAGAYSTSGRYSLVRRQMASGVTNHQWQLPVGTGTWGKFSAAMLVVKGANAQTVGAVVNRSATSADTPMPSVVVPAGGILLAFAGDRVSSQTSATVPAGMTEQAKYVNGGGGGVSVMIATQLGVSGASGVKTASYGVASPNGAGLLIALSAASGAVPVTTVGADSQIAAGANKVIGTGASSVGSTSAVWTKQSGPAVTINSPTSITGANVTPTVAGVYVFRLTGTNSDGATYDELTLIVTETTVEASGVVANPGNFVPVVAASVEEAVSDASDTTWAESDEIGASITFQLQPVAVRPGYTVRVRMRASTDPAGDVKVELLQGSSVISDETFTITTSFVTYSFTLTSPEVASITNTSDLRLRLTRI